MKVVILILLLASYFSFVSPAWASSPESQGVSSRAILDWIVACEATSATNGFKGGSLHGFVILRHGKVIAEGTWAPQDTLNEPHMLYSHSKSFTSTAVGFLVDDGKWAMTEWHFSNDLVEPLFEWCGTRKIAANGRPGEDGALLVSWQFIGGVEHGCFRVFRLNLNSTGDLGDRYTEQNSAGLNERKEPLL